MTIIAFISQKGGVGKSTLSQALAAKASQENLKVLLADCDPQQATSQRWVNLRKENNLPPIDCQVFNEVKDLWTLIKKYDLIVIDAPARTSQGTYEIALRANLLIQPTGASRADLEPAIREFNSLVKNNIPKEKLLFVLNHLITDTEEKAVREYLKKSNYHCLPIGLYDKASYRQAQNEGKSIAEISYKSLQQRVNQLLDSILDYLPS